MTYTYNEAFEASKKYFEGDELAARVWATKYALKDSQGNYFELTPDDMHRRIAREIARIERKYKNPMDEQLLFDLMNHFRYLVPQGSPMAGIGNNLQVGSLSNCFVIGLKGEPDSYGGIIKIDEEQVQLMKRRGGVGHDLSHLRPKGAEVKNSALTSTGLVPFMERYSNSTREVAQDGRRGALMLTVSVKHPDSEAFVDAKMTEGKITGANVSLKIDDAFMQAAIEERNTPNNILSTQRSLNILKTSTPPHSGTKSFTMLGRAQSLACFSGILLFVNHCPTAMPTLASRRFQPILVAKSHCVLTTVADCWQSTSIPTLKIHSRQTLNSISASLRSM